MTYATTQAHLVDELDRLRIVLEGAADAAWVDDPDAKRREECDGERADAGDAASGAEAELEVDASELAAEPARLPLAVPESARETAAERAAEISDRVEETPADVRLRLRVLADRFDLSRRHLDVLLLALAPSVDDGLAQRLDAVQPEVGMEYPTVGLVEDLCSRTEAERLAASALVGPDSPLREHGLVQLEPPGGASDASRDRTLGLDYRVVAYLKGHGGLDPALADVASIERADASLDDLRLADEVRDRVESLDADEGGRVCYFHGPDGAGRERVVDALADGRVLRADLEDVLDAGLLDRLRREARLLDRSLHLRNVAAATDDGTGEPAGDGLQAPDRPAVDAVVRDLAAVEPDVYLTGADPWTPSSGTVDREYAIAEFPAPDVELRRRCWAGHEGRLAGVDPAVLASTFQLTQGQIDAAVETADAVADGDSGGFLSSETVLEGCRAQSAAELESLAERIEPSSTWEDIVLPERTERELREVAARVKHRGTVAEQWGFEERFSRGTGVVAMFAGPSGTGKTMAAEIVAADAGMDCYRIDLSSVVSKYIGETEENLERIFDAARDSNAILLFDEADAVFGERAAVSDATDRYANVEVNYLLQRIEAYDGVVLLTTNNEGHVDSAFQRRIHQTVAFRRPDEDAREAIWRLTFPDDTPTDHLDFAFLAEINLTGGTIRNAAQTAAVLAADDADADAVGMRHVVEAVQRELDKLDEMIDPTTFGEYREFLRT